MDEQQPTCTHQNRKRGGLLSRARESSSSVRRAGVECLLVVDESFASSGRKSALANRSETARVFAYDATFLIKRHRNFFEIDSEFIQLRPAICAVCTRGRLRPLSRERARSRYARRRRFRKVSSFLRARPPRIIRLSSPLPIR